MTIIKRLMIDEIELGQKLVDQLECAVDEINRSLGLSMAWAEANQPSELAQTIWKDWHLENAWIRLNQDNEIPSAYIDVIMPSPELCFDVGNVISSYLPICDIETLLERAHSQLHSNPSWLIRLGLTWIGDESNEIVDLVNNALESENRETRFAAVFITYFLKWPSLKPLLQKALNHETDSILRERLKSTLMLIP